MTDHNDTTTAKDTPAEHETTPADTADLDTAKLIKKLRNENANLRSRLRETETAAAAKDPLLDSAHWQLLEATRGKHGIYLKREALEALGHSISDFRNDDGTLNHEKYQKTIDDTALDLGLKTAGAVIPRAGYQPTPPSGQSFTRALQGDYS